MSNSQPPAAFTPSDFSAVQMRETARSIERSPTTHFDALIIGAGFPGMYMLHSLRDKLGLSARVLEAGNGVGGTNSRQSNRLSRTGSPGLLSYLVASQAGSPYRRASWPSS
jgi:cation diffusion facilitator CzcD-associated flavoprotein CzcO